MVVVIVMTRALLATAMAPVRRAIGIVIGPDLASAVRKIKIAIVIVMHIVIASENQAVSTLLEWTTNARRMRLVRARPNNCSPKVHVQREPRIQPLRTPPIANAPSALAAIAVDVDAAVDAVAVVRKAA